METADILELGGKLLVAWSSGYGSGLLIGFYRRFLEQL